MASASLFGGHPLGIVATGWLGVVVGFWLRYEAMYRLEFGMPLSVIYRYIK